MKIGKILTSSLIGGAIALSLSTASFADGGTTTDQGGPAITQLQTDMTSAQTLIQDVIPLAVSCAVFGAAMQLMKRLIYA